MNRFVKTNLLLLVVSCVLLAQPNTSTAFKFKTNTGDHQTIVIPAEVIPEVRQNANASYTAISPGDEIGVFFKKNDGTFLCVGATRWQGPGATTVVAWADDVQTGEIDGFRTSDGDKTIYFKIYVASTKYENFADAIPRSGVDIPGAATTMFQVNGITFLNSLKMKAAIGIEDLQIPETYTLSQNYPNPFNPTTKISYTLPKSSYVTLTVYDLTGKEIAKLLDNTVANTGTNYVEWNGKDMKGRLAASGVYFYKIEARSMETGRTDFLNVKSMVLMK